MCNYYKLIKCKSISTHFRFALSRDPTTRVGHWHWLPCALSIFTILVYNLFKEQRLKLAVKSAFVNFQKIERFLDLI